MSEALVKYLDMRDIEPDGVLHNTWTKYRNFDRDLSRDARFWEYSVALYNAMGSFEGENPDEPPVGIDVGGGHSLLSYYMAEVCGWQMDLLEPVHMPKHAICQERNFDRGSVDLIVADGRQPDAIPQDAYGVVLCISVLEHLDVANGDHMRMLRNLLLGVRDRGRLVLTIDAADHPTQRKSSVNGFNYVFGPQDVQQIVEECLFNGFRYAGAPDLTFDWTKKMETPPTKYPLVPLSLAFDRV